MAIEQTKELLSLTNDYVFRRVFGEKNVDALADFLSAVLDIPGEELSELVIDDPNLHRNRKDGKSNELDLRVRKKNDDCFNRFRWYNSDNGTELTDAQEINVLELAKLPEASDGTKLWKWLKLLMLRRLEEMEDIAKDNNEMKKVIVTLREMSADEAERRLADARMKEELDRLGARQYGERIGREIGEAEGRTEAKQETARRMKEKGYSKDEISELTGLGTDDITKL